MIDKLQIAKSDAFGEGMLRTQDKYSRVWLKHIPIMITDKGKVLCVPYSDETSHIGFVAHSGKGKGIGGHSLFALFYWFARMPCVIVNDFQQETFENSLPCMNPIFNNNLKMIGLNPMPLPMVYVYPSNRRLQERGISTTEQLFPHLKMSLPTSVVIKDIENFYKLDKSGKYVTGYIEEFLKCENLSDIDATIQTVLEENFPDSNGKKFEEMKFKIRTIFKNIFDEQITDSSSPADSYAYLTINKRGFKYKNLTVQALMAAGFVPSIQTGDIKNERWFSAYMSFIIKSIYSDKFNDDYFKGKPICLYVPEIDKMYKTDIGLDKGALIKKELSIIGTNGRRAEIRMIWDSQIYSRVTEGVRENTKYLFVGRMNADEEIKDIKKDWGISKDWEEVIKHLIVDHTKGVFEFVAITTDKFVLYNPRDGSVQNSSEPQRGRLITPLSQHKQSGVSIETVIGLKENKQMVVYKKPKTMQQKIQELR